MKIPKRDKVIEIMVEEKGFELKKDHVRDFVSVKLQEKATNKEALNYSDEKIVEETVRKGSIDLGGGCRSVKCSQSSSPSACALCPVTYKGETKHICTGPISKETARTKSLLSTKTVYRTRIPDQDCPYMLFNAFDQIEFGDHAEAAKMILPTLRRHEDHETVDFFDGYNVSSLSELRDTV
jgi:hypothetical protein